MHDSLHKFLVISLGGVLGANARYWASGVGHRLFGPTFPYGTLLVNLTGCFGIGLLMTLFLEHFTISPMSRLFLVVGVLGGYTTFSAFGWETYALIADGQAAQALANTLAQVVGGLAAVWAGVVVGRVL